jgi:hypothetical protein
VRTSYLFFHLQDFSLVALLGLCSFGCSGTPLEISSTFHFSGFNYVNGFVFPHSGLILHEGTFVPFFTCRFSSLVFVPYIHLV